MSPVHLRDLGFQRNQPEEREGLSRTRRPGRGHLGHSGGWQNNEGDNINPAIHTPIQQEPQTRGLEGYGSSSSASPTPQTFISMEHGQQEVQPSISLGRTWSKLPEDLYQRDTLQGPYGNHQRLESYQEVQTPGGKGKQDKGESSHYPSYRRTVNPDRAYSDSFRLTRSRPNQLSSDFTPFINQQLSDQEVSRRRQGYKGKNKTSLNQRKRESDPMIQRLWDSVKEIEHNAVSPESNFNSNALWLQISQYAEKTQKQFSELEASHERTKELTASMDKIAKTLQEGHAQLSKASEETNKRLNIVFKEQHHTRRDRDCLDQDINKFFNVYHNMKPQPQGHVMDNQYHPYDIKPDSMLGNKARSPSQYQDGDNISYSEKEALKQLPEASSWPKFSGTGEYDHMELIYYIDGLFIDVPSIPDYWITAKLNTEFKGHASIWYTEMKEIHGRRKWPWWKSQSIPKYINDDIANTLQYVRKRTNIGKLTPYRSSSFKEKQPFRVEFKEKPKERVAEVTKKKNSCHNCGSTHSYTNNCPKAKKKFYAIGNVPKEESPTEDCDSDSMGDSIREQSNEENDPREEFLVEYQEETH
ncbi:hypothetical protein O181_046824 [Austropuccinia psidii MF-1]|uniref:Uncharacterized protein n=1 Tax=Austropuccinia psidii MF-1 TaxID=1389203 RepID=A0A9Q3DPP8_9BASI|nr:hypothetical protein [Austropuccinia psidii MF-1]